MPSKSRRLPGGKVRRPPTRAKAATAPEGTDAAGPPEPVAAPPPLQSADTAALRRTTPQTVQLPIDAMPSASAAPLGSGADAAAAAPRGRGAVTARTLTGRQVARTGPTLVMVGIITVLAVVLH